VLFNSYTFAIFFCVVLGAYYALRSSLKAQNLLLLAASYVFYGWWDVRFLFLIILSTVVDYTSSLVVDKGRMSRAERNKAFAFLNLAAFLFVTVQWSAVSWSLSGLSPHVRVSWGELLPNTWPGWGTMLATLCGSVLYGLLIPVLGRLHIEVRRKVFLGFSVVLNLAVLGFFKYFNFFAESLASVWTVLFGTNPGDLTLNVILPVGISFFTFQTMSHTMDVYRRAIPATSSLVELATYVAFFPQLVAGPIERGAHLLPQFQRPRTMTRGQCKEGLWLIFWGLYKKMVVADNLSRLVNATFGPFDQITASGLIPATPEDGLRVLFALYAFATQIYCDFSGYSDIARGTAKMMGFDIMLNFNLPYFSVSPSDFWLRWHISLSTWLRDYLYIPLGGNRYGTFRTYRNLFLTMLLGGLWHGAAWTFVLWGAFHGLLLMIYRAIAPGLGTEKARSSQASSPVLQAAAVSCPELAPLCGVRERMLNGRVLRWTRNVLLGLLMFHLTCLGWLLFRAQNTTTVGIFLQSIVTHPSWSPEAAVHLRDLVFYSGFLILFQIVQAASGTLNPMARWHWFVRLNVWIFIVMSLLRLTRGTAQEFIYFAF